MGSPSGFLRVRVGVRMPRFKHSAHRRVHLERQQPKKRRKFGVLEHKKDYIRRAKDYHAKETRIKRLKEMAALRNPEEFHMGMINTLAVQKGEARRRAELRLAQTQDAAYVTARIQTEQKAIDRLKASTSTTAP